MCNGDPLWGTLRPGLRLGSDAPRHLTLVQGICASPGRAGRARLRSGGNLQLRVYALQPAEKAGVTGLGRAGLVLKLRWEGSLVPHPWPVHFRSSAIHEFSCCSSPTSKMMSVRSFTWWEEGSSCVGP